MKMPRRMRAKPITTRLLDGLLPLKVEIRRGSSAASASSISANNRFSCSESGIGLTIVEVGLSGKSKELEVAMNLRSHHRPLQLAEQVLQSHFQSEQWPDQ
jgi:hypothetical protein